MVSYSNGKNRYCTDCYRLSQVLESFPLENLRVKTVNDREPFGADRSEVFPVPEPVRPVPVPVFSTVDQKPSNAGKQTVRWQLGHVLLSSNYRSAFTRCYRLNSWISIIASWWAVLCFRLRGTEHQNSWPPRRSSKEAMCFLSLAHTREPNPRVWPTWTTE